MAPLCSDLFTVKELPNSGRGVVASKLIAKDTLLLRSEPPVAQVIFHREYRKEVCAWCLHYALGRSLPVRHTATGRFFCSLDCQSDWLSEQGELGLAAWVALTTFLQPRSKRFIELHQLPAGVIPNAQMMEREWAKTQDLHRLHRQPESPRPVPAGPPNRKAFLKDLRNALNQSFDPDVLSFLVSGILFHHKHPNKWQDDILALALDPEPYRSEADLRAHMNSYLQLACSVHLPFEMYTSVTAEICNILVQAASHNAFGIYPLESTSPDRDEYMGYSVYPDASYFNHSCVPNVSKQQIGRIWEFRAARDIAQGEECCISYLGGEEKDLSVSKRRERLKTHWGFRCQCLKCVDDANRVV